MFVVSNDRSLPVKGSRQFLMLISKVSRPPYSQLDARQLCSQCMPPEVAKLLVLFHVKGKIFKKDVIEEGRAQVMALAGKNRPPYILFFLLPFFFCFFQTGADDVFPSSPSLLSCSLRSLRIVMSRNTHLPVFVQVSLPPHLEVFFRFWRILRKGWMMT